MLAVFLHLRNAKTDLNDKSKQIDALETKALSDLFDGKDITTIESEILAEYPTIENALTALKKTEEITESRSQKDGGDKQRDGKGGIDFRALPVGNAPVNTQPVLTPLPAGYISASAEELDSKWKDIRQKIQGGPMPYKEIKEYVSVCCNRTDTGDRLNQASAYLLNLLRLEEDAAVATAPELKDILCCLG
jgi:hypothetical protein